MGYGSPRYGYCSETVLEEERKSGTCAPAVYGCDIFDRYS